MIDYVTGQRFWSKVDQSAGPEECWNWIAGKSRKGYGIFGIAAIKRSPFYAHRLSYQMANGDLSDDMTIDHKCRNRACVNPSHLRQVTSVVNTLENSHSLSALNAAKTHCPKGHEYAGANIKIYMGKNGRPSRVCRACANLESARQRLKRKAKQV